MSDETPSVPDSRLEGAAASLKAIVLDRGEDGGEEFESVPPPADEDNREVPRVINLSEHEVQYRTLDLLQEDVHRLFFLGDVMGALVSLERIVLVAGDRPHVRSFLTRNSDKLLHLYEQVFGRFGRVVVKCEGGGFLGPEIAGPVLLPDVRAAIDGKRTIREIMDYVDASDVEVATALHHMLRTRRATFA